MVFFGVWKCFSGFYFRDCHTPRRDESNSKGIVFTAVELKVNLQRTKLVESNNNFKSTLTSSKII